MTILRIEYLEYMIEVNDFNERSTVAIYRKEGEGGAQDMLDEFEKIIGLVGIYENTVRMISEFLMDVGFRFGDILPLPNIYKKDFDEIKPAAHPETDKEGWHCNVTADVQTTFKLIQNTIKWKQMQDNKEDLRKMMTLFFDV